MWLLCLAIGIALASLFYEGVGRNSMILVVLTLLAVGGSFHPEFPEQAVVGLSLTVVGLFLWQRRGGGAAL